MKQHYGTIPITSLGPYEVSKQVITSGWYSLSSLSTIPYVQLQGSHGAQKIFSWGEMVFIPDGETALVKNMSCHRGDIFLNGGKDYSNIPARITVPVPVTSTPIGEGAFNLITPGYGVDTRRARKAFFCMNFTTGGNIGGGVVWGQVANHSHSTDNSIIPSTLNPLQGIGFASEFLISPNTLYGKFPLDFNPDASDPSLPHTLLDCGFIVLVIPENSTFTLPPSAYYILEY